MSIDDTDEPLTDEEYHAHPAESRSGIVCFRDEGRRMYHGRHVLRLPEAQKKPTDAMNLGTITHAELLQPGSLNERMVCLGDTEWTDYRKHAAQQWKKDMIAAGKIVVKNEELQATRKMVEAVAYVAGNLFLPLGEVITEQAIFWQDPVTGLACRCKPDWLVLTDKVAIVPDLKTTEDASPDGFESSYHNQKLWVQSTHYSRGVAAKYGLSVKFLFVVVEKKYPFRVGVYDVDDVEDSDEKRLHDAEYLDTLQAIKECKETGDWAEPWEGKINRLTTRRKAFQSDALRK